MIKILLSPAKSLNYEKVISIQKTFTTQAFFIKEANFLAKKLQKLTSKDLEKMMHISKDLAELNKQRYEQWYSPEIENTNCKSCIEVFNGEAYKGLDAQTFSELEVNYLQDNLRILSGLYGILKPLDLIYPYRLEMGTKWKIDLKNASLYTFWKDKLTKYLNKENPNFIVNLASSEYYKSIDTKKLKAKVITPIFKEFKNGEYKVIMMYAKHARGNMTRYCVKNQINDPEQLKLYNELGYSYNEIMSTETDWVFTRS